MPAELRVLSVRSRFRLLLVQDDHAVHLFLSLAGVWQTNAMAGEIVHYEIAAADADRAQAFWSGLFGWSFQGSGMPEMDYRMAQITESAGAAIYPGPDKVGHPIVYHNVDDIDASIAKVKELGGSAGDKMPVPTHGWFAACKDTEGNSFSLWQADSSAGQ
jgi:uncharacterized protein